MKCKLCGNEKNNTIHKVPERVINTGAVFEYLECGKCKSWMLAEEVDVSEWYPQNYNVYDKKIEKHLRYFFLIHYICRCSHSHFDRIFQIKNLDVQIKRLCGTRINCKSKILDVGCANGSWLDILASVGFKRITGVDLFIPDKKVCGRRKWKFVKGDIFDIRDKNYDLITLNHSFEHMLNPLEVLKRIYRLLSDKGVCEISIPLANGDAHRKFGEFFCQLDAPRHTYIFGEDAMVNLCKRAELKVDYINYDSHELIYSLSEGYKKTSKSHSELLKNIYTVEYYKKRALMSNKRRDADQAIFYLSKNIQKGH